jgi:hypothetical protein
MAEVQPLVNKLFGIKTSLNSACQIAAVSMHVPSYLIIGLRLFSIARVVFSARKEDKPGILQSYGLNLGRTTCKILSFVGALIADDSEDKLLAVVVIVAQQGQAFLLVAYKKMMNIKVDSREVWIEAVGYASFFMF